MKNLLLVFSLLGLLYSCSDNNTDTLTGNKDEGGLLTVKNNLIGYVVGNGNTFQYKSTVNAFQSKVKVTSIAVYKQFTNTAGVSSNKVLLGTYPCSTNSQNINVDINFTYPELISGLTIGGSPLPTNDTLLNIGDYWTLTYVTTTDDGQVQEVAKTTKVAVGTRFAGNYKVIQGEYWRINVPRPDVTWVGETRTIESVNSTTYKFIEFAGPFGPPGSADNTHYFTIDASDVVKTPTTYNGNAQLLNGFPLINCDETPTLITNACGFAGPQNIVVRDNVNGKDRIYRTYGYNTTSGSVGPREIYEVLEKIVE